MKKLLYFLLLATSIGFSQTKISEYKASNQINYKVGDTIPLGRGSGSNGTFIYLQMGGMMAGEPTPIGPAYNGLNVIVKKMKKGSLKGAEKVWFVVNAGNIVSYNLFIEDAIAACEIRDCKLPDQETKVPADKYDQLKKIKDLLDSGILSQAEYDVEKKKILDQ